MLRAHCVLQRGRYGRVTRGVGRSFPGRHWKLNEWVAFFFSQNVCVCVRCCCTSFFLSSRVSVWFMERMWGKTRARDLIIALVNDLVVEYR